MIIWPLHNSHDLDTMCMHMDNLNLPISYKLAYRINSLTLLTCQEDTCLKISLLFSLVITLQGEVQYMSRIIYKSTYDSCAIITLRHLYSKTICAFNVSSGTHQCVFVQYHKTCLHITKKQFEISSFEKFNDT